MVVGERKVPTNRIGFLGFRLASLGCWLFCWCNYRVTNGRCEGIGNQCVDIAASKTLQK
jgi:hypothetical protein